MKKIVFTILLICILTTCIYNYTYAAFSESDSIWEQAKEWIKLGNDKKPTNIGKTGYWSTLAGLLTGMGIWVIIISGMILGIRFMIVSPDNKAEVKKAFKIWLIGTLIILCALTIWKTLVNIFDIY